ncbi:MAG: NAD(P)-dependent oxidoreductase [Spirochaetes bacterium]|nr:MAG: NAD(P)-dependent oxidoreductase [Spirochaetota bacterium]
MKILLTGAFGNVGLSTLYSLLWDNRKVRILEVPSKKYFKLAGKLKERFGNQIEILFGDIRNEQDVEKAIRGADAVIHLAAIIPPLADEKPALAKSVNVGGTRMLVSAMEKAPQKLKLLFASSVAVYGDRRSNPIINPNDPPNPNPNDHYSMHKLECENIIRSSALRWTIFRLTAIASTNSLKLNPILFDMPLDTCIEICHSRDAGLAFARAVCREDIEGKILHIAGGTACRTVYRDYLNSMFELLGLGRDFLPDSAFSNQGFHCGYMTTEQSQRLLGYQHHTLKDFYEEVGRAFRFRRVFSILLRPFIRGYLLAQSRYYRRFIKEHSVNVFIMLKEFLRVCFKGAITSNTTA